MSQYSGIERRIASILQRHPRMKRRIKRIYQRLNYYGYGDRQFVYEVSDGAELSNVPTWYEIAESTDERFFGYFDVHPWNQSMEAMLLHEVKGGEVEIGTYRHNEYNPLVSTSAWNLQQGARTQWHPTGESILFNDVDTGDVLAKEIDTSGELLKTYNCPIQAVSPDGTGYLSINYDRLDRNRPDYGYGRDMESLPGPGFDGLRLVEMDSGNDELLISLQSLIERADTKSGPDKHYVNHALFNPTGEQFVFLHRWQGEDGRVSRLYVSDLDGNYRNVMDETVVSHYCWISDSELFVWGRTREFGDGYHILDVDSGEFEYVNALDEWGDGHPSLSPDGRYIVTDTYPDRKRQRHLLLYDREEKDVTELGRFFEPLEYTGETRCDLHPRWSPDGTAISFDSAHTGRRDSYILDVSRIID